MRVEGPGQEVITTRKLEMPTGDVEQLDIIDGLILGSRSKRGLTMPEHWSGQKRGSLAGGEMGQSIHSTSP